MNWFYFTWRYFTGLSIILAFLQGTSVSVDLAIILGVFCFLVIGIILYFVRTKYILYENSILVIQSGKRNFWLWEQLTNYKDTRFIARLYGINVDSFGGLRLQAGETEVFYISVMTANLSTFIEQYQSRLAEQLLNSKIDRLDEGKELYFPYLTLSHDGMEVDGELIPWNDISDVKYRRKFNCLYSITIFRDKKRPIKVGKGKFDPSNVFIIMGIVDFHLGTKKLESIQRLLVIPYSRLLRPAHLIPQLMSIGFMLLLFFFLFSEVVSSS